MDQEESERVELALGKLIATLKDGAELPHGASYVYSLGSDSYSKLLA